MIKLYIGNKNYSSWSLRPWVLMRALDIPFEEVKIRFDGFDTDSHFKKTMRALHPTASVPVLVDGEMVVADTLAITEYLAEQFPDYGVWPSNSADRHQARVLAAIMHSGFGALRHHCIMNIEADLPQIGAKLIKDEPDLTEDLAKLEALLGPYLKDDGYLFGAFSAADAFYTPVMSRLKTYDLPLSSELLAYRDRVLATPAMQEWIADALAEQTFFLLKSRIGNPAINNAYSRSRSSSMIVHWKWKHVSPSSVSLKMTPKKLTIQRHFSQSSVYHQHVGAGRCFDCRACLLGMFGL